MTETLKDVNLKLAIELENISQELLNDLIKESQTKELHNEFKESLELVNTAWHCFQNTPSVQDDYLKSVLLLRLCQANLKLQNYNKLQEYSEQLFELSRQLQDDETEAQALSHLAVCYSVSSDYVTAMPLFIEVLGKSNKLGMRSIQANCLINIGNIYANIFNYDEALKRYHTVLREYEDVIPDSTHIIININIGNLYYASEQYKLSISCCEAAIDNAIANEHPDLAAHAHALISRSWLALKDLNKAMKHARKAADYIYDSKRKLLGPRAINLLNMAQITLEMKDIEGATTLALRGIAAARRVKDDTSELRGFNILSDIFKKAKDYEKALRCQTLLSRHQNEYLKKQRDKNAIDIEIKYTLREKERKIEELVRENRLQSLLIERNSRIEKQNEQLRQANEELQQFAYITSHDLKEPLRMIGSFTQVIERQYAPQLGDNAKPYFHYISDGVSRMNSLLDALLQYATIGKVELEIEEVNMNEAVRIAKNNLHVKVQETEANILCDNLPTVRAINSFMIQLFQNLLGNALKFKKEDDRPIILVNAEDKDTEWQFTVKDNGIGISPEHRERVFVIFQRLHTRAHYEGTGIGLAICHKIITHFGGRIWVESEQGRGATFCFTLPK
jgi:signal transduction histidine kinase